MLKKQVVIVTAILMVIAGIPVNDSYDVNAQEWDDKTAVTVYTGEDQSDTFDGDHISNDDLLMQYLLHNNYKNQIAISGSQGMINSDQIEETKEVNSDLNTVAYNCLKERLYPHPLLLL